VVSNALLSSDSSSLSWEPSPTSWHVTILYSCSFPRFTNRLSAIKTLVVS
jgi:hypothetical protein